MTIDRISYEELFPSGNFSNKRIRFEASITPGENPIECTKELAEMVKDAYKSLPVTELESMTGTKITDIEQEPKSKAASFIEAINSATTLKAVEIFRPLVTRENIPELTEAFENKIKSFQ